MNERDVRKELEEKVKDAYAELAKVNEHEIKYGSKEWEMITSLLDEVAAKLAELARETSYLSIYKWATEKILHLHAILCGRFRYVSKISIPPIEKELIEDV